MNRFTKIVAMLMTAGLACLQAVEFRQGYVIAIPSQPSSIELLSADEIAEYLNEITGNKLNIVSEDAIPDDFRGIYVGQTAFASRNGINFDKLDQEEWIIRELEDGSVILTGGRPRGILYSVYDYLERRCGILWLDEHSTVIPDNPGLGMDAANPLHVQRKPSFIQRQIYDYLDWQPVSGKFKERNKAFSYTQTATGMEKIIGGSRPHHSFVDYSRDWPTDQPELFSRNVEGKALIATSGLGPGQICMTNPEARRLTLARLRKFISDDRRAASDGGYPPPRIYDISQNDNYEKCTCETCRILADQEGSYAAPLLDFINFLALEIRDEYPDVMIRTFAYTYSAVPPRTMRAEDNVIIHLAMLGCEMGGEYYTYDTMRSLSHPLNQSNRERIAEWSEHAKHLAWWNYRTLYPCGPDATITIEAVKQDLKYAAEKGVYQIFMEYENPLWSYFFPLTRFLGYKLMDDAGADAEILTKRFMEGFFGASAATMTTLMQFYQQEQDNFPKRLGEINVSMREYLSDEYFQTAFRLLDKAEAESAGNEATLARIRRERTPLLGALLFRWPHLQHRERYDHQKLFEEFKHFSQESIDYYFPAEDSQGLRKSIQGSQSTVLTQIEAVSFIGDIPHELLAGGKGQYFDFNARHFSNTSMTAKVADKEAYTGLAVTWATNEDAPRLQVLNWMVNKKLAVVQLDEKIVPRDGKYHWLPLKSLQFEDNARVHAFVPNPNGLCIGFYRLVPAGSICDLFLSIKHADGKFWMDRAILHYMK